MDETQRSKRATWIVVTGLDGSGKTTLVRSLSERYGGRAFRLPYHDFVRPALSCSGHGGQFSDVLTDRLVFAADARLTNYLIAEWRCTDAFLVSQRGWMDNYVFGAVQGVSWAETGRLLQTAELERPSAIIHLVADADTAFERIRRDPKRDKYETLPFMRRQYKETLRLYRAVEAGNAALIPFVGIPSVLIDTTHLEPDDVFVNAQRFLDTHRSTPAAVSSPPQPCTLEPRAHAASTPA